VALQARTRYGEAAAREVKQSPGTFVMSESRRQNRRSEEAAGRTGVTVS
jgi:hypothetical protein